MDSNIENNLIGRLTKQRRWLILTVILFICLISLWWVVEKRPLPGRAEVRSLLINYYHSSLKPEYQDGFGVDESGAGKSETQSYALLQSYFSGDKETFDKVWRWTKANLQKSDHLFYWKFYSRLGQKELKYEDQGSATDADTDIAFALIKAGEDWSNEEYVEEGVAVAKGIWSSETVEFSRRRYLLAGNWANLEKKLVLNPSYFSPAAYRSFAKYDPEHDWMVLADDQYEILQEISQAKFKDRPVSFLPPNWVTLDKQTGEWTRFEGHKDSLDYSYDAFRVYWRVALDELIYPNDLAKNYLGLGGGFEEEWKKVGRICSIYEYSKGKCRSYVPAFAGPLGIFSLNDPSTAEMLIRKYYLTFDNQLNSPLFGSFYDKSWYWFGLRLWVGLE